MRNFILCTAMLIGMASRAHATTLSFMADLTLPNGLDVSGTTLGGLSGLSYDSDANTLFAISDDKGEFGNPRFYNLSIDLSSGAPAIGITSATSILTAEGAPFALRTIDPEGIAVLNADRIFVSSEGNQVSTPRIAPAIFEFHRDGSQVRALDIPDAFIQDSATPPTKGVRQNEAFETLTLTQDRTTLFTAAEDPLIQDGDEPTFDHGGDVRILRYHVAGEARTLEASFAYHLEPTFKPAGHPNAEDGGNGLSDMLALNDHQLIAIERGGVVDGDQYISHVALYKVTLDEASDISMLPNLATANYTVAKKELLIDLNDIRNQLYTSGGRLDNIEGITFGPRLANGHRSILLVSDNNFSDDEITQFLAFEVTED